MIFSGRAKQRKTKNKIQAVPTIPGAPNLWAAILALDGTAPYLKFPHAARQGFAEIQFRFEVTDKEIPSTGLPPSIFSYQPYTIRGTSSVIKSGGGTRNQF